MFLLSCQSNPELSDFHTFQSLDQNVNFVTFIDGPKLLKHQTRYFGKDIFNHYHSLGYFNRRQIG